MIGTRTELPFDRADLTGLDNFKQIITSEMYKTGPISDGGIVIKYPLVKSLDKSNY